MKKTVMFLGMLSAGYAYSQQGKVGINTSEPKATLEIAVASANTNANTNEGLLIPRLSKARVEKMPSPEDGTLVYVDNVAHTSTNAKISEITQKGFYYYRKDLTKWVKIANGIAGADGASMLTGNGTPQNNTGANGDSYVDQNTGNIWTKANNTWTNTNKSLKGPQGQQGIQGPAGTYVNSASVTVNGNQLHRAPLTGDVTAAANNNAVTINNNAITSAKIKDGQVMKADLATNSVDSSKIQDGTVANTDIANNAINSVKIADGTIEGIDIKNETITKDKLANGVLQNIYTHDGTLSNNRTVGLGNNSLSLGNRVIFNSYINSRMVDLDVKGYLRVGDFEPMRTRMEHNYRIVPGKDNVLSVLKEPGISTKNQSYTLDEWDHGSHIYVDSSTPVDITIPANLPREFSCVVVQKGAGQVTVKGNGVTLQTARGIKTRKQFSAIGIIKDTANTATITGDAVN